MNAMERIYDMGLKHGQLGQAGADRHIERLESTIGNQEVEIARLTTLVAEGERREKLLTAAARAWFAIEEIDEQMPFAEAQRRYQAEDETMQALTDAGFTADGWTEDLS